MEPPQYITIAGFGKGFEILRQKPSAEGLALIEATVES
jgi:hypothetical protein